MALLGNRPPKTSGRSLRVRIIVTLVSVIVPTFLIVTLAENQLVEPLLREDLKQNAVTSAKNLAAHVGSKKRQDLLKPALIQDVVNEIQKLLLQNPNLTLVEVYGTDPEDPLRLKLIANAAGDDEPMLTWTIPILQTAPISSLVDDEGYGESWRIVYPIRAVTSGREPSQNSKILGAIHLQVSLRSVEQVVGAVWRITGVGALISVLLSILGLFIFLKRTLESEKLLEKAEEKNIVLSERLHEAQRKMMHSEKLAVLGTLTANLAHEIGTPLNALGGHLELLRGEVPDVQETSKRRIDILLGQVQKIEGIVKGLLKSTAAPVTQTQLVDLNQIADQIHELEKPRIQRGGVEIVKDLDRSIPPIRMVPVEWEQVLLNLFNNALDSIQEKAETNPDALRRIELKSQKIQRGTEFYSVFEIRDTGNGIRGADLDSVFKPFYTTKPSEKGTGLGLTISQQIIHKYSGKIEVESVEDEYTAFRIELPVGVEV
jgi:signal transduction histidine kinase